MDRRALHRPLADIEAGKGGIVGVYKIDRLTRSLTDFSRTIEVFERHGASVVSVTQPFDTTTSTGRRLEPTDNVPPAALEQGYYRQREESMMVTETK
jgi:DNA invertase Pin-like site-specific DNA recombinase